MHEVSSPAAELTTDEAEGLFVAVIEAWSQIR